MLYIDVLRIYNSTTSRIRRAFPLCSIGCPQDRIYSNYYSNTVVDTYSNIDFVATYDSWVLNEHTQTNRQGTQTHTSEGFGGFFLDLLNDTVRA